MSWNFMNIEWWLTYVWIKKHSFKHRPEQGVIYCNLYIYSRCCIRSEFRNWGYCIRSAYLLNYDFLWCAVLRKIMYNRISKNFEHFDFERLVQVLTKNFDVLQKFRSLTNRKCVFTKNAMFDQPFEVLSKN